MWERLAEMRRRVEAIDAELATPAVAVNAPRVRELSKERARLEPAITLLGEYERVQDQLSQARDVAAESDDAALQEMAQSEVSELEERLQQLTSDAKRALIPARSERRSQRESLRFAAGPAGMKPGYGPPTYSAPMSATPSGDTGRRM